MLTAGLREFEYLDRHLGRLYRQDQRMLWCLLALLGEAMTCKAPLERGRPGLQGERRRARTMDLQVAL